jgi:hypothetical protein
LRAKWEQAKRQAGAARGAKRKRKPEAADDAASVIDHFNQRHAIADLLAKHGYEQDGASDHWRSPYQSTGTFATMDAGDHWVSLSESDAVAGIGAAAAGGYRWGDAFDLYVHYEHGGDRTRAICAYAEAAGIGREKPASSGPSAKSDGGGQGGEPPGGGQGDEPPAGDAAAGEDVGLEDFVAHLPGGVYYFLPTGEPWPGGAVSKRVPSLIGTDGKRILASTWLDRNRRVEQTTWAPGEPQQITGRLITDGGWITRPGCTALNRTARRPSCRGPATRRRGSITSTGSTRTRPSGSSYSSRSACSAPRSRSTTASSSAAARASARTLRWSP